LRSIYIIWSYRCIFYHCCLYRSLLNLYPAFIDSPANGASSNFTTLSRKLYPVSESIIECCSVRHSWQTRIRITRILSTSKQSPKRLASWTVYCCWCLVSRAQ